MWNNLPFSEYYISFTSTSDKQIYLTDFISIWYKCFYAREFLTCLKESNRLLEIEESILLGKAVDMLQNVAMLTKVYTSKEDNNRSIVLEITRMEEFPVKLKVCLDEGCKSMFFQRVTQPLLKTVSDLKASEKALCQLLSKKDREIKEYKEEGGKIALRHLKTPLFDDQVHMRDHSIYSRYFGFMEMPNEIINSVHSLKQEPNITNFKQEILVPNTNNDESSVISIKRENFARSSVKDEPGASNTVIVKLESTPSLHSKQEPSSQSSGVSPRKRKKIINL